MTILAFERHRYMMPFLRRKKQFLSEAGLELKLSSNLIYILKKTVHMMRLCIPMLKKCRFLIFNPVLNGEKLYFMKVILLYLVLKRLFFRNISYCRKEYCLFFISVYGLQ